MRRPLLILLLLLLALVAAAFFLLPRPQPSYNGLTLSQWLEAAMSQSSLPDPPSYSKAADAIQHIGTNAIPWLVEWTLYDGPDNRKLRLLVAKLPRRFSGWFHFVDPDQRRNMGTLGFAILGDTASPAVPKLARAIDSHRYSLTAKHHAIEALGYIGRDGAPVLLKLLAERQKHDHRLVLGAVHCLGGVGDLGTNRAQAAALLLPCLHDSNADDELVFYAAAAIGYYRLEPAASVPALMTLLNHPDQRIRGVAASALGHFGEEARPALPGLERLQLDPVDSVKEAATNAVEKVK
jgi:HEAT repeat protein